MARALDVGAELSRVLSVADPIQRDVCFLPAHPPRGHRGVSVDTRVAGPDLSHHGVELGRPGGGTESDRFLRRDPA